MSANPRSNDFMMTEAEYLEFERNSDIKHEYYRGEVFAMAGASPNHNRLTLALSHFLFTHLSGSGCEAFGGDQLVEVEKLDTAFFPDISVVCGESQFTDDSLPALLNPILIIEVLSSSTEAYDRGKKFQLYRQLDSLQEYVLVAQDSARIECFYLNENDIWELTDAVGLESSVTLKSIDCTLNLADIYANVVFEDGD